MRLALLMGLVVACDPPVQGTDAPPPVVDVPEPEAEAFPPLLRRLTRSQYQQSVSDVFGPELVVPTALEPDARTGGLYSVGAASAVLSPRGVELYEAAAQRIARQVAASGPVRDRLISCVPALPADPTCASQVVSAVGERLWRRPLTSEELGRLVELAGEVGDEAGDFYEGVSYAVAALLQSPNFLYRVEVGEADPEGGLRFSSFEMASRLSFFLWNTTPDAALLADAASGALTTEAGRVAAVDRLLADPRARAGFRNYVDELLALDELDHLVKDPTVFPAMRADLGSSAREETLSSVEALVFDRDDDFRTWLTTRQTFLNPTLAMLYAVPAPVLDGFGAATLPEQGLRRGLLGQASVLAHHAHPVSSSATKRGVFVREVLLCQEIPPPPANVDTSIPEPSADAVTLRDRVATHLTNPQCAGCHQLTDPIGLALENFDGIGIGRTTENGATIDPSGDLDGEPFADARDLASLIASDPGFARCMTETLYAYAAGHRAGDTEEAVVDWLNGRFAADGYSMRSMLRRVALSDAFRKLGGEP